jgi:capsular polysaccharide biosynthesis protein
VISHGGSYERIRPIAVGPSLPACFDPPQTVTWEDERVIYLEGCRYWGEYGGSIIAHDEHLIGELSRDVWGLKLHAIFNRLKLPAIEPLTGLTAVISTPEANANYSHWMMDLLPRLDLLARAGYGPEKVDRYLVNLGNAPYERETLTLAGIPKEKIFPVSAASHFRCERIITTSLRANHWQNTLPAWVSAYLGDLVVEKPAAGYRSRRLYLTRNRGTVRRVLNEESLLPLLQEFGFEVVDPGALSVREQAALFAGAEAVVAPHGSALTNLVFCQPGTAVLEIFPADYFDVAFWTTATVAGCRYHAILGQRPGSHIPQTYIEGQRQDIIAPPGWADCLSAFVGNPSPACKAEPQYGRDP